MANQHTLTFRLSQATERQLLAHIASRMETHMADMTAALDRLAASLAKEIADIRDDLLTQIDGLTAESQAAKDALAAKVAELDNAVARVESFSDELDANDAPAPAGPEQPEEPVDPDAPGQYPPKTGPRHAVSEAAPDTARLAPPRESPRTPTPRRRGGHQMPEHRVPGRLQRPRNTRR